MTRPSFAWIFLTVGLTAAAPSVLGQAGTEVQTIWRCTDPSGKTHVTNVKDETSGKDCKIIQSQRVTVMPALPATKPAAKSPGTFPKESVGERASARDRQRAALESELSSEEALLAKARAELAEQESIRTGGERNYAKVLERLQKYKDNVDLHTKNADELRKEIGKLR
jgi:hypothetical protein